MLLGHERVRGPCDSGLGVESFRVSGVRIGSKSLFGSLSRASGATLPLLDTLGEASLGFGAHTRTSQARFLSLG